MYIYHKMICMLYTGHSRDGLWEVATLASSDVWHPHLDGSKQHMGIWGEDHGGRHKAIFYIQYIYIYILTMYICTYICILCYYVHMYICIITHIYIYTFIYIHRYLYIYIYVHMYTCIYIYIYMYIHTYIIIQPVDHNSATIYDI